MRKLIFGLIFIFTLMLIWINVKLYSENFTTDEKQRDIILQLDFIGKELKVNNLGKRMQEIFPEGFVFTNALYGLSWCELANSDATDTELKNKALKEAIFAYNEIDSDKAKAIFDSHLTPENGIYYVGWKNYLLSNILKIDTTFTEFKSLKDSYINQCEVINEALKQSNSPYLQSYDSQSWPADMFLAMASLKNHDNIFKPKYENDISEWVKSVKSKLDPKTKLIPHKVNSRTGRTLEGARGSSISLIIRLLAEIEVVFAKEQFELYKTYFATTTFGLPSIGEYPKGESGDGDIDSGPVVFGIGFSGTIVSIGTFAKLGNLDLAERQYKTINAFGFGSKSETEKKYVFGLMPIADAFIAWGRATELNNQNLIQSASTTWRIKFHVISIIILVILWTLLCYKRVLKMI